MEDPSKSGEEESFKQDLIAAFDHLDSEAKKSYRTESEELDGLAADGLDSI